MKKWPIIIVAVLIVLAGGYYFSDDHQRYLAFDRDRDVWHRQCDVYVGQPPSSPEAADCAKRLSAMMAYAKHQGW